MELADPWAETALWDCHGRTGSALTPLVNHFVTPPANFLLGQLDGKEDDDTCESDGSRESSRDGIVVS